MTSQEIIAAMAERYADCSSYRDSGCVLTERSYSDGRPHSLEQRPFITAFVRPDRFRFESKSYRSPSNAFCRYIVCSNGETVRQHWDRRPERQPQASLSLALAGATGVSGPSAHTIPTLLMPGRIDVIGLSDLVELTRLPDETLGDVDCYRIYGRQVIDPAIQQQLHDEHIRRTGRPPGPRESGPMHLWIERDRLLLRRLSWRTQFNTRQLECITTYEPQMDVEVTEDELHFLAPIDDSGAGMYRPGTQVTKESGNMGNTLLGEF